MQATIEILLGVVFCGVRLAMLQAEHVSGQGESLLKHFNGEEMAAVTQGVRTMSSVES
jgi:hypothetical protein